MSDFVIVGDAYVQDLQNKPGFPAPVDGDVVTFDAATNRWGPAVSGDGGSALPAVGAEGDVLTVEGGEWAAVAPAGDLQIEFVASEGAVVDLSPAANAGPVTVWLKVIGEAEGNGADWPAADATLAGVRVNLWADETMTGNVSLVMPETWYRPNGSGLDTLGGGTVPSSAVPVPESGAVLACAYGRSLGWHWLLVAGRYTEPWAG